MSEFYTDSQRKLQTEFDTTDLADRIKDATVTEELSELQEAFINSRNMFYLSTVDELGYPSCSYKGGSIGFVRAIDSKTIVFPSYDGNGMYMSTGNIQAMSKIGLLFIDFQTPQRLRVRGEAKCIKDGTILDSQGKEIEGFTEESVINDLESYDLGGYTIRIDEIAGEEENEDQKDNTEEVNESCLLDLTFSSKKLYIVFFKFILSFSKRLFGTKFIFIKSLSNDLLLLS